MERHTHDEGHEKKAKHDTPTQGHAAGNLLQQAVASSLRDAVARVARGDLQHLRSLKPPTRTGVRLFADGLPSTTDPPPLQTIAISGCQAMMIPYLAEVNDQDAQGNLSISYDRFTWWDKASTTALFALVPNGNTNPLVDTFFAGYGALGKGFECEFNHPLVTIVGSRVDALREAGYPVISWDGLADGASPNSVKNLQFSVRVDGPDSVPRLRAYADAGPDQGALVIVNEGFPPGRVLPDNQFRPALFIDFDRPQRAVGLEFGYLSVQGIDRRRLDRAEVLLTALGKDGMPLPEVIVPGTATRIRFMSNAKPLVPSTDQQVGRGTATNRIGVVDFNGRISSVKLEFLHDTDQGGKIVEPQVISRIWHEELPPAAVQQDKVAFLNSTDNAPDPWLANLTPGPRTINLPYLCDNAAVVMRGFRLKFFDQGPRKIKQIGCGFDQTTVFSTSPGGPITITPKGSLLPDSGQPAFQAIIYYSLIAWDSTQIELQTVAGTHSDTSQDKDVLPVDPSINPTRGRMVLEDPCPLNGDDPANMNREIKCGPLFGGLTSFLFTPTEAREINEIDVTVGTNWNNGLVRGGHTKSTIRWGFFTTYNGHGGDAHQIDLAGTVLTGRSLKAGILPSVLKPMVSDRLARMTLALTVSTGFGPRPTPDTFQLNWQDVRESEIAWPISAGIDNSVDPPADIPADMAFLALNDWECEIGGGVREVEMELLGKRYDGLVGDWEVGVGVSKQSDGQDQHFAFGFPTFGALVRKSKFAQAAFMSQGLTFDGVAGLPVGAQNQGAIFNNSGAAAFINAIEKGGTRDDRLFDYTFIWRDGIYSFAELVNILPLRLRPGQYLFFSGTYTPDAPAGGNLPANVGTLIFRTSSTQQPTIVVTSLGRAAQARPDGAWEPSGLDFTHIWLTGRLTLSAALHSTGNYPLIVNQFLPASDPSTFAFSPINFPIRIEPGQSQIFTVTHTAPDLGAGSGGGRGGHTPHTPPEIVRTLPLYAVTNATSAHDQGMIELRLAYRTSLRT